MNKQDLRIVFMGTPDFAVPSLRMLIAEAYPVVAVFTQPDRPKGRGHKLLPPPVKVLAQEAGIAVYQPQKVSKDGFSDLSALRPNLLITAAFGQILSREVLALPKYGCINVHASLLPKYRGAAPIEWAILNGEETAGVTTMYTAYALDAGDMLLKDEIAVPPEMTGGQLRETLSVLGAGTLKRTLAALLQGTLRPVVQDEREASYYPIPDKALGRIDWNRPTKEIVNLVRALNPAPMAYTYVDGQKVKIFVVKPAQKTSGAQPGTIVAKDAKEGLFVKTADGVAEIVQLQFPGGRPLSAKDYLRGKTISAEKFSQEG